MGIVVVVCGVYGVDECLVVCCECGYFVGGIDVWFVCFCED